MSIVCGPYRFVKKSDTRIQRTICILDSPCQISIRYYNEGRQVDKEEHLARGLDDAMVRF